MGKVKVSVAHPIPSTPIILKKYKGFDPSGNNANALKEIISKFQENNIDLILFTTPLSDHLLNNISENEKQEMLDFLHNLSNEYDIKIIHLYDKYVDLNVWTDPQHVAYNENSLIFSNDVIQIILEEMS